MSFKYMNMVMNCEDISDRSEFCVLLALAYWSDDEGKSYPSTNQLAKKSRLSRRAAQGVLDRIKGVYVEWDENSGGRSNRNQYQLISEALKGAAAAPFSNEKRVQPTTQRVQPVHGLDPEKGATDDTERVQLVHEKGAAAAPAITYQNNYQSINLSTPPISPPSGKTLIEKYGPELWMHPAVLAYCGTFAHLQDRMLQQHREMIALKVGEDPTHLSTWQTILDKWAGTIGWRPEKVHNLIDAFERERDNPENEQNHANTNGHQATTKRRANGSRRVYSEVQRSDDTDWEKFVHPAK